MSMDLYFEVKGTTACVDFPVNTGTNLTYDIYNEKDNEKRLEMLREKMVGWEWTEDEINEKLQETRELLEHDALTLFIM